MERGTAGGHARRVCGAAAAGRRGRRCGGRGGGGSGAWGLDGWASTGLGLADKPCSCCSRTRCASHAAHTRARRLPKHAQATEGAIEELQLNGCTREEATAALAACGGSVDDGLVWLLERRQQDEAEAGGEAVGELMGNGLSRRDAEAALAESGGDVDQASGAGCVVWLVLGRGR